MKRTYVILIFIALAIVLTCLTVRAFCMASSSVEPEKGVGRIETVANTPNTQSCVETCVETSVDTTETEMPENEPYIASEGDEMISFKDIELAEDIPEVDYDFVEDTYVPDTEEYVEVVPEADPIIETDIDALIVEVAAEYGLPWQLVRAVVWAESTFDQYAVSDTYDYGLMQVSYIVWNEMGIDLKSNVQFDARLNLETGCRVLKGKLTSAGGDMTNALTMYRFGDGEALKRWERGEYSNWYTDRVLTKYYEYLVGGY